MKIAKNRYLRGVEIEDIVEVVNLRWLAGGSVGLEDGNCLVGLVHFDDILGASLSGIVHRATTNDHSNIFDFFALFLLKLNSFQ